MNDREFVEHHSELYKDINTNPINEKLKKDPKHYNGYFFAQRLLIVTMLLILPAHGILRGVYNVEIFMYAILILACYKLRTRPFKSRIYVYLNLFNDFYALCVCYLLQQCQRDQNSGTVEEIDRILYIMNLITFGINGVVVFGHTAADIIR